ncbi:conserved hypothetical protein [Salinibacter ruber M8]|uniref:Uncharacterized protein n=2 Tax=Salinibacter ruber TaxID=146919 RepID=D5H9Y8_SALRM|nr:conserved hypothetical protein [Salinibacter ruber M8]
MNYNHPIRRVKTGESAASVVSGRVSLVGCPINHGTMSSWTRVSFDPGKTGIEAITNDLQKALEDPDTFIHNDMVVWKAFDDIDAQRLTDLGIEASRALVMHVSDTSNSGSGRLYKRIDSEFILLDAMSGGEGYFGRDVLAYMQREHGLVGAA